MKPVNRHLLVELPIIEEEEKSSSSFLLPEEYRQKTIERYTIVSIKDYADDCKIRHQGKCVVETSMIEDISIGGKTYQIIPENFVVLLLEVE
tara:strand:- start:639 stop:914 length:276 start_codon:yes stop_codon:yes gene_type:complete